MGVVVVMSHLDERITTTTRHATLLLDFLHRFDGTCIMRNSGTIILAFIRQIAIFFMFLMTNRWWNKIILILVLIHSSTATFLGGGGRRRSVIAVHGVLLLV